MTIRPQRQAITLERDCEATLIPGGRRVTLSQGDEVIVTQSLGGSFTVQTSDGYLARLSTEDGQALGLEPASDTAADEASGDRSVRCRAGDRPTEDRLRPGDPGQRRSISG